MAQVDLGNVRGQQGLKGVGIKNLTFKETDSNGNNIYTIILTDDTTYDIIIPRGPQGQQGIGVPGPTGSQGVGIQSIRYKELATDGSYIYTITLTNGSTADFTAPIGPKGEKGERGEKGETTVLSLSWNDVTEKPATFPPASHAHDDRYYTESEIDEKFKIKLDSTANAVSATKLQTARTINGVAFDGTANITIADSTKVPISGNSTIQGNLTMTGACNAASITSTGNVTAYSDRRVKSDLKEVSESLDKLKTLTAYEYLMITTNEKSMGFMADEVEKVFPTAVIEDENGIKKVAYIQLIAPIVEAIKELEERIKGLEMM